MESWISSLNLESTTHTPGSFFSSFFRVCWDLIRISGCCIAGIIFYVIFSLFSFVGRSISFKPSLVLFFLLYHILIFNEIFFVTAKKNCNQRRICHFIEINKLQIEHYITEKSTQNSLGLDLHERCPHLCMRVDRITHLLTESRFTRTSMLYILRKKIAPVHGNHL